MTEKELVLKAIEDGEYEVEIVEPNNVRYHERYDGTPFYVTVGDDIKFGVCAGSCTVYVREHSFTCELDYGEWSGDDLLDDDIIEALEDADGVIWGEHLELDAQWEVYSAANNITEDIPYFWCEDDECYKDVDELDRYYSDVTFEYAPAGSDDWEEAETEVDSDKVYELYKALKAGREAELESGRDIVLTGEEIRDLSERLHEDLMDEVENCLDDPEGARIRLTVSKSFFDEAL